LNPQPKINPGINMVQYRVQKYSDSTLQQDISNLSLLEAYQIAKPPFMNPHNNRWHIMMYNAVLERIALLEDDQPLLVAWEEEMENMDCKYNYIRRMPNSSQ
jgi:hypothetical protein